MKKDQIITLSDQFYLENSVEPIGDLIQRPVRRSHSPRVDEKWSRTSNREKWVDGRQATRKNYKDKHLQHDVQENPYMETRIRESRQRSSNRKKLFQRRPEVTLPGLFHFRTGLDSLKFSDLCFFALVSFKKATE